jgi:pyruvate dehydrogenase E2 component (dihydrolipoamide acetyltransferase)
MPSLGADMEAGTLSEWKIKAGDPVKRGDIVAVVETEKADIDVEIYATGTVKQLLVQPGTKVPVGAPLALIDDGQPATVQQPQPLPARPAQPQPQPQPHAVTQPPAPGPRVRVSPLARQVADKLGVNIRDVQGTGPEGAITREDVERVAAAKAAPPAAAKLPSGARDLRAGMRRIIAAAMSRSNREIPHYYLESSIDMSRALDWLREENLKRGVSQRILPPVLLLRAVARSLGDVPELNAHWAGDQLEIKKAVNINFAVALRGGGLVNPAILDVDQKNIDELAAALADLVSRTRTGRLRNSEMSEGTITVTSLGDFGVETVFGVIYPPQVALVGFGRIEERPWAVNGLLGVRPVIKATLAGDHRATDGRQGAQFLDAMSRYLMEPEQL